MPGKPPLLSEQELRFAEKYAKAEAQLLGKSVLGMNLIFIRNDYLNFVLKFMIGKI